MQKVGIGTDGHKGFIAQLMSIAYLSPGSFSNLTENELREITW